MGRKILHTEDSSPDQGGAEPLHPLLEALRSVLAGVRGTAMCLLDSRGRVAARSPAAETLATTSGPVLPDEAAARGEFEWQGWLVRPSGGRFWAEVRTTALYDSEGRPYGFLQLLRDETRSRAAREEGVAQGERAEDAVRQGVRLLSRARRMARRGGWEWNAHTRELQVSDDLLRIFGLGENRKVSLDDWYRLLHPEDLDPFRETLESALNTGGAFRTLVRLRRPDGVERVLLCDGDAESEDGDLQTGLFGTVIDITGERLAQAATSKSERDFQAVRAQPEAIFYADSRMRIVEANPAAERMFGFPLEEVIGREAEEVLGRQACEIPGSGEPAAIRELEFRGRDGRTFTGETLRISVDDPTGNNLGTLWMISDVSARLRAEAKLAEARRRLAASREAERGVLARRLHDGPVQDLLALSYQLAHAARTSPQELPQVGEMRTQVLEVVGRLRRLIGELRPPGLAELGLEAALEGLVLRLQDSAGVAMPRVDLDLCDGGALPETAAVCVFRVTQEALQNAIKHAGARTVRVRMRLLGDRVRLTIRDDGCGFRVPDSLQELSRDLHFGLVGLAERAELARGTLAVRSEPDQGTELCLTLPLTEEPDPND